MWETNRLIGAKSSVTNTSLRTYRIEGSLDVGDDATILLFLKMNMIVQGTNPSSAPSGLYMSNLISRVSIDGHEIKGDALDYVGLYSLANVKRVAGAPISNVVIDDNITAVATNYRALWPIKVQATGVVKWVVEFNAASQVLAALTPTSISEDVSFSAIATNDIPSKSSYIEANTYTSAGPLSLKQANQFGLMSAVDLATDILSLEPFNYTSDEMHNMIEMLGLMLNGSVEADNYEVKLPGDPSTGDAVYGLIIPGATALDVNLGDSESVCAIREVSE